MANKKGYSAHIVPGQEKFDMIIQENGILIKVQVKTSTYTPKLVSTQYQLQRRVPKKGKHLVKYSNTDRIERSMETALRDIEIRAMFAGMGMTSKVSYDNKIKLIAEHYNVSTESIRKALHNDTN